ncbi:MAG: hypothetical protein Q8L04_04565 [Ignavibacteria bacterium]|nr:hypothetical protein [Ignavibacteria bacterium]
MSEQIQNTSDEISLKEIIQKMVEWWCYLKTQWLKIAFVGFIGGAIGFVYAGKQPILYTAKMTFVVEEAKNSGSSMGGLASLAGQFGVDVGGSSGGGVLSGDNILLYFKSESLAREVLLSKYDSSSNKSVADVYSEVYKLKEAWSINENIGKMDFPVITSNKIYTRLQDSLLQAIIGGILKTKFSVAKTDKKASFIEVTTIMENEQLAKIYCERVVKVAVDRYINVKTQRQKTTIDKLQVRVDSIAKVLSKKTTSGASLQTSASTMDINPLYTTGTTVAVESTMRDKTMLATIFASVVQNLELAKFNLSQETPVILVVDSSNFPLKKDKVSRLKTALNFTTVFGFIFIVIIIARKLLKSFLN